MICVSFSGANYTIFWSWVSRFGPVSYRLCSGTSGFGLEMSGLILDNSWVVSGSSLSSFSRGYSYIGSGSMVWCRLVVSGGNDWGFGHGGCSMMMVDGGILGSGSS